MSSSNRKAGCALLVLCLATAITAHSQTYAEVATFKGPNGNAPYYVNLVQGLDGDLYGTTLSGGNNNCRGAGCGTVFKLTVTGIRTIYEFCSQANCTDGTSPYSGLTQDNHGNFYGTTWAGGANGGGTVFEITREGQLTTLYNFCSLPNCADGVNPYAGVIRASDGNLYGTTEVGGTKGNYGTVYKLTPERQLTTIASFDDGSNGEYPNSGMIQATDGNLYGTTLNTVYRVTLQGKFATIYYFGNLAGTYDYNTLMQGVDGKLYGTTADNPGGTCCGSIFEIDSSGQFNYLYYFDPHGADTPYGRLEQGTDGNFYGTTRFGPQSSDGTAYQFTPSGTLTVLYNFFQGGYKQGASLYGGLTQHTSGIFYGTTTIGGFNGDCCGTIYSIDMGLGPFVTFVQPMGRVGETGPILGQGFTGTTAVSLNGTPMSFKVVSDTYLTATVPSGATTGYVTVTTPSGVLKSNVPFQVIP